MDMEWIREHVKQCPKYKSDRWSLKVDQMKDSQVFAIYKSFLKKNLYRTEKKRKEPKIVYTQLTLFDIYPDVMKGVR